MDRQDRRNVFVKINLFSEPFANRRRILKLESLTYSSYLDTTRISEQLSTFINNMYKQRFKRHDRKTI